MKKERREEIKAMISAVEHYCRLGFARGKYSLTEIGAFLHGYCRGDLDAANRLFAVCLLFLFLRVEGRQEDISLLRHVCGGIGKCGNPQKISYWIKTYARKHYYDERTVYRRWSNILSLYSKLLFHTKIKRRQ